MLDWLVKSVLYFLDLRLNVRGRVVPPDKTQLRQGVDSTPTRVDLTPTKRDFHPTMQFSPDNAAKC